MARLSDDDWLKIKVKFESTNSDDTSLEAIANQFGCSKGAISQKAKKDGWIRAKNKQTKQDNVLILNELVSITTKTKQNIPETEQELFSKEIIDSSNLRILASTTQTKLLNLITQATIQAEQVLRDNPSGLHIKSQTDTGITYGRNTELVKDLIPAMNATNAILDIGKEPQTQINVQQNNTQNNLESAKQVYNELQEFINATD